MYMIKFLRTLIVNFLPDILTAIVRFGIDKSLKFCMILLFGSTGVSFL